MKNESNQNGYALLIVLFLIVFIMTVTAVFLRGSISNAKLERKIDENNISVILAEMGVEYYSNLYRNIYLKERKIVWNEQYNLFKNARVTIGNDNKLSTREKEEKIKLLATHYRNEVYKVLRSNLLSVNINPPDNISFNLMEFDPEKNIREYIDREDRMFLNIFSEIEGHYNSGKVAVLKMDLYLFIPSMLEDVTASSGSDASVEKSFTPLEYKTIDKVIQNENCERNKRYQQSGNVKISCMNQDFIGEEIQQNSNVNITTDARFQAKQIQQNFNTLILRSGDEFVAEQITNNGKTAIETGGRFTAKQIQNNNELTIITNSKFISEQISANSINLIIKAIGEINTKQIEQNANSLIKTNTNFVSEQIQQNRERITIEVGGNFSSKQIAQNENMKILVVKDFMSEQIQQNKFASEITVGGKFEAKQIHQNQNLKIFVKDNFKSEQIQQNKDMSIFVHGNYNSKHVEQNENLKIIVKGNLTVEKLALKSNSLVCVGGSFNVGSIEKDSSSKIYLVRKNNENDSKYIKYLESEEWVSNCGMELDVYDVKWQEPNITVNYVN